MLSSLLLIAIIPAAGETPADRMAAWRPCVARGQPLGADDWATQTAARLGLQIITLRPRGRPQKGS